MHRDIKPENVLLSDRHAVVADFGIAKAVEEGHAGQPAGPGLTSAGFTLGTPAYMAPEQAIADPAMDHRADIYALGVIAYEMLAGRPPFTGSSAQELIAAHVAARPEPLAVRRPACPPGVAVAVMRSLEKRPADRPQTADEVLRAFEGAATPAGGTITVAASGPPAARRGRPMAWRIAAVAALLVVALAGLHTAGMLGTRSLIAEGALAERERVIIADFENRTADSTLGLAVTEAIRVDLTQSPLIRPLTPEQVGDVLRRMRRDSVSLFDYALTREAAGRADSAIVTYERCLASRVLNVVERDGGYRPRILFRLGELYEARGDRARAADYYSQFAELWRGADPDLQPRVAEARRRLAALTAEPGRP